MPIRKIRTLAVTALTIMSVVTVTALSAASASAAASPGHAATTATASTSSTVRSVTVTHSGPETDAKITTATTAFKFVYEGTYGSEAVCEIIGTAYLLVPTVIAFYCEGGGSSWALYVLVEVDEE